MGRKLAWALSIAFVSACTFHLAEPQDPQADGTSDLDGGGVEAAGNPADGAGILPSSDGGTADAAAEAGTVGCPSGALLCEDFDAHGITGWSQVTAGGTVTLGPGRSGSGLVASLPARDGATRLSAALERTVSLPARAPFTVAFDVKASAVQNVGIVDLHFFYVKPPYYELGLRIADYGSHSFVHDYGDAVGGGGTVGDDFAIEPLPVATWTRAAVAVTYPAGAVHALVTYDGVSKWQDDIPADNYDEVTRYISLGIGSTEHAGGAITVQIDNLVVTSP